MRVLLSTYGSRGDVEPMVGLPVQLGALGAEVWVCALPDFTELLAPVGVPLVPIGQPVHLPAKGGRRRRRRACPRTRSSWSPPQFGTGAAAAEQCDAPVATSVMPTGVRR